MLSASIPSCVDGLTLANSSKNKALPGLSHERASLSENRPSLKSDGETSWERVLLRSCEDQSSPQPVNLKSTYHTSPSFPGTCNIVSFSHLSRDVAHFFRQFFLS